MTIDELIQLLKNRLAFLRIQRTSAFERGDGEGVAALDSDITVTTSSLQQLESLL